MKKSNPLKKENFYKEFTALIEDKREHLIRLAYSNLLVLFWQIGKEINDYDIDSSRHNQLISFDLSNGWGNLMTSKSLKYMAEFAQIVPDLSIVGQLSLIITWDEIRLLLELNKVNEIKFYIDKFSPDEINKASIRFGKSSSIFKQHSFRKLTEPTAHPEKYKENPLFAAVLDHICQYQFKQHALLNTQLNVTFWEIGRLLNKEMTVIGDSDHINKPSLTGLGKTLNKFGCVFTSANLSQMIKFSEKIVDLQTASVIAAMIAWKQILVIISLSHQEDIFFFATTIREKHMDLIELKNFIKDKGSRLKKV
ncbi:MAG: hypothetical protein IT249_16605 [Chitinophagaceae bacterium]|nr:hypothetical protein [Chitinophagaceae bacterium]